MTRSKEKRTAGTARKGAPNRETVGDTFIIDALYEGIKLAGRWAFYVCAVTIPAGFIGSAAGLRVLNAWAAVTSLAAVLVTIAVLIAEEAMA